MNFFKKACPPVQKLFIRISSPDSAKWKTRERGTTIIMLSTGIAFEKVKHLVNFAYFKS